MKIVIIGASGFVGSRLTGDLLEIGHAVTGVSRSAPKTATAHPNQRFIAADTTRPGPWQEALADADAVINLAGRSIFGRWNAAVKTEIRESRILTTRHVVQGLPPGKPVILVSASGAGYYGSRGDEVLTEDAPAGDDFLARLSVDWEKEALAAAAKGARVVVTRLGVVLGKGGGAMARMIPAFKFFLGGPIGSGRQWFPWIHLRDLSAAVLFVLEHPEISGPVNLCAPGPVPNRDLAAALGRALKRPACMPAPAFMVRMALGEFGGVLLASQRAVPQRLLQHGFGFRHPDIRSAVNAVLHDDSARAARG
jgi:uncharacterized protein (TIGR01777 family)